MSGPKILLIDIEELTPIPGHPDYGLTADFKTVVRRKAGNGRARAGQVLSQWVNSNGYLTTKLDNKHTPIHVIVASVALGPRPEGLTVNHKDGNKLNNAPENLEYCTIEENRAHAVRLRMHAYGEKHARAKMTEDKVRELRRRRAAGADYHELSGDYGICYRQAWMIGTGRSWAHV